MWEAVPDMTAPVTQDNHATSEARGTTARAEARKARRSRRMLSLEKDARSCERWHRRTRTRSSKGMLVAVVAAVAISMLAATASAMGAGKVTTSDSADPVAGQFMVAAVASDGSYLLEPSFVEYKDSQTAQAALEASPYEFEFNGTTLASIKGQSGMFTYYHTKGDGPLSGVDASEITSLIITCNSNMGNLGDGHLNLMDAIASYDGSSSKGLHNYPDAVNARKSAQQGLPTATDDTASTLGANLQNAIDKYNEYISGQTYEVTFDVTCGGEAASASITLTDAYGNETVAVNGKASVVAGTYTYEAMDESGKNGVRCTKLVVDDSTPGTPVAVALPDSNWFGSIDLRVKQDNKASCQVVSGSTAERQVTFAVPDAANPTNDVFVYATASDEVKKDENYKNSYRLYALYTGANGNDYTEYNDYKNYIAFGSESYSSESYSPQYMVGQSLDDNSVRFEIKHVLSDDVYQVEACDAQIVRCPTLGSLSAQADGLECVSGFAPFTASYDVVTSSSTLTVKPQGFVDGGDYSYTVAGTTVGENGSVDVQIPDSAYNEPYKVEVEVSLGNGTSKTYTLNVTRKDAQTVTLTHDSDVSVEVYNAAGSQVVPVSSGSASTTYNLIDGQSYSYVATKSTYYHSSESFVASANGLVAVATPHTSSITEEINVGRSTLFPNKENPPADDKASYDKVAYTDNSATYSAADSDSIAYLLVRPSDTKNGVRVVADYKSWSDGSTRQFDEASYYKEDSHAYYKTQYIASSITDFIRPGGYGNSTTLHIYEGSSAPKSGPEYYQDYAISIQRTLSLASMYVSSDTASVTMAQTDTYGTGDPNTNFDAKVLDYTVGVPQGTESLDVRYAFVQPHNATDVSAGGYHGTLAGETMDFSTSSVKQTITLDPTQEKQVFELKVTHDDAASTPQTYIIRVNQLPTATVSFEVSPSDATVGVTEDLSGLRVEPNDDGTFTLIDTYDYTYTVACSGYKGTTGSLTASDGLKIEATLEKAAENPNIDPTIEAEWPYFRADSNNNSVVSAKTPTSSDDTLLYWANKLGEGMDKAATGCPILVDGYLYTYASDKIYKLDTVTGETVATGTMAGTSSFAITPMTYGDGMVFVALSNGQVQAFNADTLESLWVYKNSNGGQPNSPISYCDGKVYTGFWNKSNGSKPAVGDFVCLSATDEDPSQERESKVALWTHYNEGGYYWAGSYATEDYVVVGSDNGNIDAVLDMTGENSYSGTLYSFDTRTGKIIDTITEYPGGVNIGNIRSTPVYDPDTSRMYWVGRAGYFCSVKIGEDGKFDKDTLTTLRLENDNSDGQLSSTATPIICNGRAYVGADAGSSYSGVESGHCVDVIDLATNTVAYTVPVGGRPQSSGVCTTAYVDSEGYAYVYFVDNYKPGKVRYFKDKPGQTAAITSTVETGTDGKSYDVADVLFCPAQTQQEYCICSPIVDEYGTIYIKNDSAYMMAIGSTIEKIEITTPPDRTDYEVGESFDPSGMKVTATYSNGMTRDVTDYVTYQTEKFEIEGKLTLEVKFPHTMYQNDTTGGQVGTAPDYNFTCPTDTLELNVVKTLPAKITTESLPDAKATTSMGESTAYEATLEAIGTQSGATWSFEGTLPKGISFQPSTGKLSGAADKGTGGTYELRFTLTNSLGTTSKTLTLTVNENPRVQGGDLTTGMERVSYSQRLQLSAGYPTKVDSWKIYSGSLPDGLELDEATGIISGTPTKAGPYEFTVRARSSVGESANVRVMIQIDPYREAAAITTSSVASGEVGEAYSVSFKASGVPSEVTWSLAGSLPEGLAFDASTATISGTPAVGSGGAYQFTLSATNGVGNPSTKSYVMWVYEDPSITTTTLRDAAVGFAYSQQIATSGYPVDFEWSVESGSLPEGLALDATTGTISGTPSTSAEGSHTFTVKAASKSTGKSATKSLALEVGTTSPAAITTESLSAATVGEAYEAELQAVGAPAEFAWTIEGDLPKGMSFDGKTGKLSGTPAVGAGGTYDLKFAVDNGTGSDAKTFTLTVNEAPGLATDSLDAGYVGSSYSQTLEVVGYPDVSVSVEGLPDGLSFDADSLTISGNPKASGTSEVVVTLESELGMVEETLDLTVRDNGRLYGNTRIDTMKSIVSTAFDEDRSCKYIIVATAWNYADALSASSLAGLYNAPIVTTDGESLSDQARSEIDRLSRGDTVVYVAGGSAAASDSVVNEIEKLSGVMQVKRLAGDGRVETGLKIYEAGGDNWGDTCVISNAWNYADALAVGAYCSNNGAPIFGAVDGVLNDAEVSAIKNGGFSKVVIVGGSAAVNASAVKGQLGYDKQYVVLAGEGRVETSQQIVEWECGLDSSRAFSPENVLSVDNVAIANAWNYADALTGVSLSVRFGSPIMLVSENDASYTAIREVVAGNRASISQGWILGGTSAVNSTVEGWFKAALKG